MRTITSNRQQGFTLIELLIVIGILGILAAIIFYFMNPGVHFAAAQDAMRLSNAKTLQQAMYQRLVDEWELLNAVLIPEGEENAIPICRYQVDPGDGSCVVLDDLIPTYLVDLPVDPAETNENYTGYTVYQNAGRVYVDPGHLGETGGVADDGGGGAGINISGVIPTEPIGSASPGGTFIDVQGDYAYTSAGDNLRVFNVSNPLSPAIVATVANSGGPTALVVSGDYAFVADNYGYELAIYDLSDPGNPTLVGSLETGDETTDYDLVGSHLYLANRYAPSLQIIDVSNPAAPVSIAEEFTDAELWEVYEVAVSGNYAFIVGYGDKDLYVYDVTDPSDPTLAGSYESSGGGYGSIAIEGNYAYLLQTNAWNILEIMDISNPVSPVVVGSVTTGPVPSDIVVSGGYALVSSREAGTIQWFNVTNPAAPSHVGTVETGVWPAGASYGYGGGPWPRSIDAEGDYAYAINGAFNSYTFSIFDINAEMSEIGLNPTGYGESWTVKDSSRDWTAIAISEDGSKQTAVVNGGQIYTSTDYGNNWTPRASNLNWVGVTMSADGTKQTAVVSGGQIYTSSNSGVDWTARDSNRAWASVSMAEDGVRQTAVVNGGFIYVSTNSGTNWTQRGTSQSWRDVAVGSYGDIHTAVAYGGTVYVSSDSGFSWTSKGSSGNWTGVAISDNGSKITAVADGGQIYTSYDWGNNWAAQDTGRAWIDLAMSADGQYQTAVVISGTPYISSDYGETWTSVETSQDWRGIAMSDLGDYQMGVVFGGQIYKSEP